MGNRFTKNPFFTRADRSTSVAFPAEQLGVFKAAAEAEGVSFNRWLFAAAEAYMGKHPARAREHQRALQRAERQAGAVARAAKRKAVA